MVENFLPVLNQLEANRDNVRVYRRPGRGGGGGGVYSLTWLKRLCAAEQIGFQGLKEVSKVYYFTI